MKSRINFVVLAVSLMCCQSISAGQVIGYMTDPYNYSISDYTDIIEAWVEKDGTDLTFVMVMRGTIPSASELGYDDSLTYIWLVDADNDPTTGQSPVGSEFNIRVVISQNPALAGGYVDVVGSMTGGGSGTVDVNDNKIQITIDRSQIGAVRRLYWQCDAWEDIGGVYSENGITLSGLARICRYGVLFDPYSQNFQVGENYVEAYLETDPENPVISLSDEDSGQDNIFLSDEEKYPEQDNWQILGQTTSHAGTNSPGHAGPYNLRTFCQFIVEESDPCGAYGDCCSQSHFSQDFRLDGNEGETGMIPHGVFFLKWSHDYHIFASDNEWQTYISSIGQIELYQVVPEELKVMWVHPEFACNNDMFNKHEQVIDLADIGLELGETYRIKALLVDEVSVPDPTNNAEAASDASLLLNIDVAIQEGDFDQDWDVDLFDFALFAENWLEHW